MTLLELLTKYFNEKSLYVREGTISFYKCHIKSLISYFGKQIDVSDINKDKVLTFIKASQERKLSNNTINHEVGILKAAYSFYGINADFLKLRKLTIDFVTYGFLDNFKQTTLSSILKQLSLLQQTVIAIFLDTGVRLSELINIELANIDFDNRSIFLKRTKTHRNRFVFFTNDTLKLLNNYLHDVDKTRQWLFLNSLGDKLTVSCIEQMFNRIRRKYGLLKFSPHMLRHTFSTNLYNDRADLIFIETVMGHANTETTKRYIHTDVKSNRDRYDRFKKSSLKNEK